MNKSTNLVQNTLIEIYDQIGILRYQIEYVMQNSYISIEKALKSHKDQDHNIEFRIQLLIIQLDISF